MRVGESIGNSGGATGNINTGQPAPSKFIPDAVVAKRRYGVHPRTLRRWDNTPGLNFPPPRWINGRPFRIESQLDEFDRRLPTTNPRPGRRPKAAAHSEPSEAGR